MGFLSSVVADATPRTAAPGAVRIDRAGAEPPRPLEDGALEPLLEEASVELPAARAEDAAPRSRDRAHDTIERSDPSGAQPRAVEAAASRETIDAVADGGRAAPPDIDGSLARRAAPEVHARPTASLEGAAAAAQDVVQRATPAHAAEPADARPSAPRSREPGGAALPKRGAPIAQADDAIDAGPTPERAAFEIRAAAAAPADDAPRTPPPGPHAAPRDIAASPGDVASAPLVAAPARPAGGETPRPGAPHAAHAERTPLQPHATAPPSAAPSAARVHIGRLEVVVLAPPAPAPAPRPPRSGSDLSSRRYLRNA